MSIAAPSPHPSRGVDQLSRPTPPRVPPGVLPKLRAWQQAALTAYLESGRRDFLAVATPGAGKTTFALRIAAELLAAARSHRRHGRRAHRAPQDPVGRRGGHGPASHIDPTSATRVGPASRDYHGVALTYAQVAAHPPCTGSAPRPARPWSSSTRSTTAATRCPGATAIREAFEPATRRLALTGTPFRSDTNPIPFVRYEPDTAGIRRSSADYTYGYAEALRDGVVRPVLFLAYGGRDALAHPAGDEIAARLGEPLTKDLIAHAWRTALDPKGEWIPPVLAAADKRLTEVRRRHARRRRPGHRLEPRPPPAPTPRLLRGDHRRASPTVVLSDDAGRLAQDRGVRRVRRRWMVAVRMVSEGVDVPRLAVGRLRHLDLDPAVLRPGRRPLRPGPAARRDRLGLPALGAGRCSSYAAGSRTSATTCWTGPTPRGRGLDLPRRTRCSPRPTGPRTRPATWTSSASRRWSRPPHFDRVLFDGAEFGTARRGRLARRSRTSSACPGLLEPDQVATLLHERQSKQRPGHPSDPRRPSRRTARWRRNARS